MLHTATQKIGVFGRIICVILVAFGASSAAGAATAAAAPTKPQAQLPRTQEDDRFFTPTDDGRFAAAETFVRNAGLSNNLSLLLLQDVKNAQQVDAAIDRLGMDHVQATVVHAIKSAQQSHETEWVRILAGIYSQHFNHDELQSIITQRELSPYFSRLVALQDTIADAVRVEGQSVFNQALNDVMGQVTLSLSR